MAAQGNIRCSVANCHYFGQGNVCEASAILVTSDVMCASLPAKLDAPDAAQVSATPIGTAAESCCKTFVPKASFRQNEDGVTRP